MVTVKKKYHKNKCANITIKQQSQLLFEADEVSL